MSSQSNPDFRGIVPSKDIAVLDQSHFYSKAGGRDGGTKAGHSSSYHHKVECSLVFDRSREQFFPEFPVRFKTAARGFTAGGQEYGVTPPVQAGEIMQHNLMFPFPEMVIPARLPAPSGTLTWSIPTASDSEFSGILLPVYPYTEYSGSLSIAPEGSPVLGPDP